MTSHDRPAPHGGIMDIAAYVPGRGKAPGVSRVYKLSSNETPLGASPAVAAAVAEAAREPQYYPDGSAYELRQAIGRAHGLNPDNIVVTGNPIVDILQKYYYDRKDFYDGMADERFFSQRGLERGEYYLMTCHRRENVHEDRSLRNIVSLLGETDRKIYFTASYRTQKVMKEMKLALPPNVIMVDPIGYQEMLVLMTSSRGAITDSGTVVEETCVLQIPSLQMRKSTERPQVYDVGSSVKFDPTSPEKYPPRIVFEKLEKLHGKTWPNPLGDGKSSRRIAEDLLDRLAAA